MNLLARQTDKGDSQDGLGPDSLALRRLIDECSSAGIARQAFWLRLSLLPSALARPHHLRLARAALDPLMASDRARLFRLPGADIVVVWRGEAESAERACREAIGHLFVDDGLSDPSSLVSKLLLPCDGPRLAQAIDEAENPPAAPRPISSALASLDIVSLALLESRLAGADVARFARRRDVCAIDAGDRFTLRWEQRFLSMTELSETLAPDRDPHSDPWLLRRLTRTLDRRMLALLAAPGELAGAGPFALNLNVDSILAPEFLRFDAALPPGLRGRVVLELLPTDLLADPSAFLFARDFARARGYRLLLRLISAELLDVLPLALGGLDLLQLHWSPALMRLGQLPSSPGTMVLAGVDSPEALTWGRDRGIEMFQGTVVVRGRPVPQRGPSLRLRQ